MKNTGTKPGEGGRGDWGVHLDLFQEEVGLHKAVVHEAPRRPAVLQEAGWIGTHLGVGAD